MIKVKSKISYDNRGSALIMALVVSAVLMVLSLSLLAVSYSLFLSQKKNTGGTNERELFYSAIEVFEQELLDGGHKVFDENTNDETIAANMDDNSFGTQIIDSIFLSCDDGYIKTIKPEMQNINSKWNCFILEEYDELDDEAKKNYIDSVSRYFNMTCFGAYSIKVQMFWEFDAEGASDTNSNNVKNNMKAILLHVIYRLNKSEDTLIKNERTYRLETLTGGAKIIQDTSNEQNDGSNNGETGGEAGEEQNTDTAEYYALEFGGIRGQESKYAVDPEFFQGMDVSDDSSKYPYDNTKFPYIKIKEDEFNDNLVEKYDCLSFLTKEGFNIWYCDSNKTIPWNGTYDQVWKAWNDNKKIRILRTDWGGNVPVRIKFIINGNYIDLDMYEYRYIKHVVKNAVVGGGDQPFINEAKLNNNFSDAFLEACGITVTDTDNSETIIWKLKDGNSYYNFFNEEGKPIIKTENNTNIGKTYCVYATFPSYYNDSNFTSFKKGITIPQYDPEKTFGFSDFCNYTVYSFKRIIGQ